MKISYNWLKWYVPDVPEAKKLEDVFTYHLCEVEGVEVHGDDTIFDINILPNRAHDLLSHMGIAKELSGLLGIPYTDPTSQYKIPAETPGAFAVSVETQNCRRYIARVVRNVKVGPSPEWVVKHLESIGQKSINNIVDATNLVMFNAGQPMHVFDLKKLSSEKIIVRAALSGEKITTLDSKEIDLKETDMVIADEEGILALAGVKGGTKAEVDEHTTDIVIEVANFDPVSVRKTARKNNLLTDAAKRFENDLSPELASYALREMSALIVEMCPDAIFEEAVDVYPNKQEERKISFNIDRINKKLGASISGDEAEKILTNYGFLYERTGADFTMTVPPLRLDLVGEHDMTEEIGRIIGYDKVLPVLPPVFDTPKITETAARIFAARKKLLADGFSEVMTYSFAKNGSIEVARGAKGKEFLRRNLSDGIKIAYEHNRLHAPLLGMSDIKIFDIGTVYPEKNTEEIHVAYADSTGVVESTLEEFTRELPLDVHMEEEHATTNIKFIPWSAYPFITRDVAVWVPVAIGADELVSLCKEEGTELLVRDPQLFDEFIKDDKKSLAVRMVFQASDRTLTDDEIGVVMQKISQKIQDRGWDVR